MQCFLLGAFRHQIADYRCVYVKQIVTRHSRFPWNASWNQNHLRSCQTLLQLFIARKPRYLAHKTALFMPCLLWGRCLCDSSRPTCQCLQCRKVQAEKFPPFLSTKATEAVQFRPLLPKQQLFRSPSARMQAVARCSPPCIVPINKTRFNLLINTTHLCIVRSDRRTYFSTKHC